MSTSLGACPSCGIDLGVAPPSITSIHASEEDDSSCQACGQGLFFRVEPVGPIAVMHLQGRGLVTEQNVMRGLEQVRHLISDRGRDRVLIDFQGVSYLSSTILARLINLARLAKEAEAILKLSSIQPDVQDIFRIARLEGFFEMYASRETALTAF